MFVFEILQRLYSLEDISAMYQRNLYLLAQNDRLVLSFRLRGRSTSSLFKKSLSDGKHLMI